MRGLKSATIANKKPASTDCAQNMATIRLFELMLLLFLLLLPSEMLVQVRARECKYRSHLYKGWGCSNQACYVVCQHEGFERGQCEGLLRRCICTKECEEGGGGGGGEGGEDGDAIGVDGGH